MTFEEFIENWRDGNDYFTAHTSGSTGEPKEIRLSKDFAKGSASRTNKFFGINETSRLHSCVSPEFIGGKMMAVRAEIAGAKLTWEKPSNEPLKEIKREESIDLLAVVPSQMISILERVEQLPHIRNIIVGGSAIHPELRERIALSGLNAYETYGMTETASHIALREICLEPSPFRVLPGVEVEIDMGGRLRILFDKGEEILTNDLARIEAPGEFFILGRCDNVIISGGRKINPEELEAKISRVISQPFYIKGVKDEKWGEKVVLVVEGEEDKDIMERLKGELEKWEVPKDIERVRRIEMTGNGKIKRERKS